MTDKEHLEISRKLALAIGWPEALAASHRGMWQTVVQVEPNPFGWRVFDYRDWNVIGPIAERYKLRVSFRDNIAWREGMKCGVMGVTPQLAIALAVIAAQGVK